MKINFEDLKKIKYIHREFESFLNYEEIRPDWKGGTHSYKSGEITYSPFFIYKKDRDSLILNLRPFVLEQKGKGEHLWREYVLLLNKYNLNIGKAFNKNINSEMNKWLHFSLNINIEDKTKNSILHKIERLNKDDQKFFRSIEKKENIYFLNIQDSFFFTKTILNGLYYHRIPVARELINFIGDDDLKSLVDCNLRAAYITIYNGKNILDNFISPNITINDSINLYENFSKNNISNEDRIKMRKSLYSLKKDCKLVWKNIEKI